MVFMLASRTSAAAAAAAAAVGMSVRSPPIKNTLPALIAEYAGYQRAMTMGFCREQCKKVSLC